MKNFCKLLLYCCMSCIADDGLAINSISIICDREALTNPISNNTIKDCTDLLKRACNCDVRINNEQAEILLKIPRINDLLQAETPRFAMGVPYPYLRYPEHDYRWNSYQDGEQTVLQLDARSFNGISCGLYGLLQEQLWFAFYHPKETYIPKLEHWPLTETFTWVARARFDKKGFHLHTMHPIELTQALLDVNHPDGIKEIKEYIDWLARNQQNYFEFNLLESIDREKWSDYMQPVVQYAHARGILIGLDISMHMTQQKAYMLYRNPPFVWKSKRKQISENLQNLFKNKWDVLNVEFSTTEFSAGNLKRKYELRNFLGEQLLSYKAKLMGREHVVTDSNKLDRKKKSVYIPPPYPNDRHRGTLIHTVMFYTASDAEAPVYGNRNLRHMLQRLNAEKDQRETWYYPESAYWITFDNSVPMTLLPYLQARLDDILLMDSLEVKGHITFSSGWEWGHWLVDWSIARWSWKYEFDGEIQKNTPFQYATDIFSDKNLAQKLTDALTLQQHYIKDKQLIRYMAPSSVTDELPKPLNLPLQPRPEHSYRHMRYKYSKAQIDSIRRVAVVPMREFARKTEALVKDLQGILKDMNHLQHKKILTELLNGIEITGLRAEHRASTLSHLLDKRQAQIEGKKTGKGADEIPEELLNAQAIRKKALRIVQEQEQLYRYPVMLIARPLPPDQAHTAYRFGYLHTASDLFFWKREEEQVQLDKYGAFFRLIWDIPTIVGAVD